MVGDIGFESEARDADGLDFGSGAGHLGGKHIHQRHGKAAFGQRMGAAASDAAGAAGYDRYPLVEFRHGIPSGRGD